MTSRRTRGKTGPHQRQRDNAIARRLLFLVSVVAAQQPPGIWINIVDLTESDALLRHKGVDVVGHVLCGPTLNLAARVLALKNKTNIYSWPGGSVH
jgi:hypothetical protein